MSQISSVSGAAASSEALSSSFYVPASGPIGGIIQGYPATYTGYNVAENLSEINAYADGSSGYVGIILESAAQLGIGKIQYAGESVLMFAARSADALVPADIGKPMFLVGLTTLSLTRVASTDPLAGVLSFVDAGTGDFKILIEQDKPDAGGGGGYTSWTAEDDNANTQAVTNGYVLEFNGSNGIDTDASVANVMTLDLPSTTTDMVGFHYDSGTGKWKATEVGGFINTEILFDTDGILGFAGDSIIQSKATANFSYSDLRLVSTGNSGRANLWVAGTGANGGNIYFSEASVAGNFPLPSTYNSIQATTLINTNQSMILFTGIGTGQPVDSTTALCLSEGNSVQIGGTTTGSPLRTGKNLNTTAVYGGAENNTVSGLLAFSDGTLNGISSNGYVSGNRTTVTSDGTIATAAEWYLGAASTTGVNIDYYSQYRAYRLTCSYQNSTDGIYQTETITIISDLTTPTWALSDFLSTGAAASEILWDVDYVNPGGTSSVNYLRVRVYSSQAGKTVQLDISGQGIGGNLI